MCNSGRITLFGLAVLLIGMASCSKDVYDEEKYQEIIRYLSPVDSVDQRHTWSLTDVHTYRFTADAGSNIQSVCVFTENPLTSRNAELMNQVPLSSGNEVILSVSVPSIVNTLYAALVDKSGNFYVTSFSTSARDISFEDATVGMPVGSITPQTYTYVFEEDFPQPGDYDYNDLVLRISQQRTGTRQLTINVTIAAIGASYHLAGGIRLVGYRFQDIDSVKTVSGESFNDGVPQASLYMFDKTDLLVEGRNKEAVINLFCDAHWAMAFNISAEYGLFQRKKYNVSTSTGDNYQLRSTRTLSYVVYLSPSRGETELNNFTLESLDPFIITEYNGGTWETHLDTYRDAQVLFEYPSPTIKDLPWALKVPMRDFAYPLEGNEIGFKKKTQEGTTALFGAYMTSGHSFGEWAEDYTKCLDWYQYPVSSYVW